jgi:AcrR family transcriptional regulator
MGTVAEQAEVTRALVYKHFDNRNDILVALYRREAAALDRRIRQAVIAADEGFEPRLRSFIHAVLESVETHAEFFAPLRALARDSEYRSQQRSWDRRTVAYFAALAGDEYDLDPAVAKPAIAALLSGIVSQLTQAQPSRSPRRHTFLEDLFVDVVLGALSLLRAADLRE